jgi:hypothetical protein
MTVPHFDPDFASPADWAAMYRSCGLQVVPCYLPGEPIGNASWKRPRLTTWSSYTSALVDQPTFFQWYGPGGEFADRFNMGVITGSASDQLMVVDLDIHKNPAAARWWHELMEAENNGLELETVEQHTGGGGVQKLFRCPPGFKVPTNRTDIGVDIRGQAGFAVLAPSLHDTGKTYCWMPGHEPWEIEIAVAPQWLLDAVIKLVGAGSGNGSARAHGASPDAEYDAFGHRQDGREDYMFRLVWAAVVDLYRECPIKPPEAGQLRHCADAYEVYERGVTSGLSGGAKRQELEQQRRGPTEFFAKWRAAMKHWDTKVREDAAKPKPGANGADFKADFKQASDQAKTSGALFEYLDIEQILALADPQWLIDKVVIEQSLGFLYGPPGSLKTFIGLDIALSLATGQKSWWGYPIERSGTVIYISSEGQANLKFRVRVWEQHRGVSIKGAPFRLIRQPINFMAEADVGKLLNTVQAIADETHGPIAAVFVDTVSRVLPGAEENLQKDMTIFVAACDAVRNRFSSTVIGIHHTNYAGGIRGSTVIPGAGDFLIETRREPGAATGSIFAKKIKDAEDGWERFFKVTKVTLADIVPHYSLVLDGQDEKPAGSDDWLPPRDICRQILAAIDEEWIKKKAWCFAPNSSRNAVKNIMLRWQLKRETVKKLLDYWTANKIIEEGICDPKTHTKGYQKTADL